jgi:Uma2 family endonuclease
MTMTKPVLPLGWEQAIEAAYELGIRLEMVGGLPIWEAHPVPRHQIAADRIRQSIRRGRGTDGGCCCIHYPDVDVLFPDGSIKRPDIAIYCRQPDELDSAVTLVPEAVIEILSAGYEKKDTVIGVPFYLEQGVKDVVLLDPKTGDVTHHRMDGVRHLTSPEAISLECGCEVTV